MNENEEKEFDPYEILGVDKESSQEEIKSSFKKLSKKFHPDKKGGDKRKFQDIAKAYVILGSEENKGLFDIGEYVDEDYMTKIVKLIVNTFVNNCMLGAEDPLESMRAEFELVKTKVSEANKKLNEQIKSLEKYKDNITKDPRGILKGGLDNQIEMANCHIKDNEKVFKDHDMALDFSKDFEFYIPEELPDNQMVQDPYREMILNQLGGGSFEMRFGGF